MIVDLLEGERNFGFWKIEAKIWDPGSIKAKNIAKIFNRFSNIYPHTLDQIH